MQVVVDGILTNYQIVGNHKKTLLILHGWKRSLSEWLPIAKHLSDRYKVVLLDLPGFGQTHRPATSYTIYDYASFVEHFLNKIEVNEVILMGHSFGGRLGIILGAKTHLLEQLILVDSAAVETKNHGIRMRIALNKAAVLPVKLLFPKYIEKLKTRFGSDDYQSSGQMRDIFINTVNADLTPLLKAVKVKTLVVWGENDPIRPISEGKFIKDTIPGAKLRVVWGAGHSPYLEKQKEFMDIVNESL